MLIVNRLPDICHSLGMKHLATLQISDLEVEKFTRGVPMSLLVDRWDPPPSLKTPVQENGRPPKQPENSPCANVRPPPNAPDPPIEPERRASAFGGGFPTPDSTASVSDSERNGDCIELPADESLPPLSHFPTVSGDEGDRESPPAALESAGPGTTLRLASPASTDESGHVPSQSATLNDVRCAQVRNQVDDSDPGDISGHDVARFGSRDNQSPSESTTTDVPRVSRAIPDTARLLSFGYAIEQAFPQSGTYATTCTSSREAFSGANSIEAPQAGPSASPFPYQLHQPPGSIATQSLFSGQVPGLETSGQTQPFCESGNPNATLVSPERISMEGSGRSAWMDGFNNGSAFCEDINFDWP